MGAEELLAGAFLAILFSGPWFLAVPVTFSIILILAGRAKHLDFELDILVLLLFLIPVFRLDRDAGMAGVASKERYLLAGSLWIGLRFTRERTLRPFVAYSLLTLTMGLVCSFAAWHNKLLLFGSAGLADPSVFKQHLAFVLREPLIGIPICFYLSGMTLSLALLYNNNSENRLWDVLSIILFEESLLLLSLSFSRAAYVSGIFLTILVVGWGLKNGFRIKSSIILIAYIPVFITHVSCGTLGALISTAMLFRSSGQLLSARGHIVAMGTALRHLPEVPFWGLGTDGFRRGFLHSPQTFNALLEYAYSEGVGPMVLMLVGILLIGIRTSKDVQSLTPERLVAIIGILSITLFSFSWSNVLMDPLSLTGTVFLLFLSTSKESTSIAA